jgi:preprotein translocase subunit SecD
MRSSIRVKFLLIIGVIALSLYLLYPTYLISSKTEDELHKMELQDKKSFVELKENIINLGLDLQGGMHVVLEVDIKELLSQIAKNKNELLHKTLDKTAKEVLDTDEDFIAVLNRNLKEKNVNLTRYYGTRDRRTEDDVLEYLRDQTDETVTRALEILRNRVDEFGVAEPIIQKQGENRIIVELAGIKDPTRVRQLIGKTAKLEFKLLKDAEIYVEVADNINKFIQSKISNVDTTDTEEESDIDTSTVTLEKIFGKAEFETDSDSVNAFVEDTSSIFEANLFFQHPNNPQQLLVPADKEEKFKTILELPEIQKIIIDEAGEASFVWGSKPIGSEAEGQFYEVYLVYNKSELTGETIQDAKEQIGSQMDPQSIGKFETSFTLNDEGAKVFSRVTGANLNKRLAIILDNKVFLAPEIRTKIKDGRSRITGLNSMEEAKDMAIVLKAGALPAPVRIIEERTVGASLGQDSIVKGSYSGLYGMIVVIIFMVIYYKFSGGLADMALTLNILFIMAIMAYFNATLTLPGIAGIILTIGMAVDANVLIFERIREEVKRGKTIRASIEQGYSNAFTAIIDANVTTFIAGVVLYTYGAGPIKGFALTLMIGILASLFTAIVVTRIIFDLILERGTIKELSI